ncbi:MAG TPA: TetR/AcrR family transcriptional regulator [Propionibacteriaceae bacterium]
MATPGPASTSARALAREQLTATILRTARDQLASVGPAQLSVRAVAREVGMVSSAVYRYFPSRDELLTELLVACFDEVGAEVEAAAASVDRSDHLGRWLAIAHAFRAWSVAHPYDFALLYGSPVPGYAAPARTIGPAGRPPRLIVDLVADQVRAGVEVTPAATDSPDLHTALAGIRTWADDDLPDESVLLALRAWGGLIGALTLELFGHLTNALDDHETYFDAAARRIAPLI